MVPSPASIASERSGGLTIHESENGSTAAPGCDRGGLERSRAAATKAVRERRARLRPSQSGTAALGCDRGSPMATVAPLCEPSLRTPRWR